MSFRYGVFSFLVFCVVLLLVFKNYEIWTQPMEWVGGQSMGKKLEGKPEIKPKTSPKTSMPGSQQDSGPIKSYIDIAGKNIFSPERKDFPLPMAMEAKKPVVRPQVILYGVTMVGEYQAASIVNPGRSLRKCERETITLRVGEQIGEYKLVKVGSDRITLEAEGDGFEVLLYDPKVPKRRVEVKTEIKPAAVTSTQPGVSPSPQGSPVPTQPSATGEAVRPVPQREGVQGRVAAPPSPVSRPTQPTIPSAGYRGVRRSFPPGVRTPVPQGTPAPQGAPEPIDETEEE